MYADKEKQKEANREANRRYRQKGITEKGITPKGITGQGITVLGRDGKPKEYDPLKDGIDGWHFPEKGEPYILQDTGMGGKVRLYREGERMFLYR